MKTDCCCPPLTHPEACGCCEGVEVLTPLPTANRPGLPMLSYRMGTHATFLETMKARLSSSDYPKLAELTTREADDPGIALLDAWATVADVLTFYQERIANEGYLRTATERRSILELARLVGYHPRPGVASSVYLAYTLDDNFKGETVIPKGASSQSIPGPSELPQSFETSEDLKARAKWNNLKPRMTQPQTKESIQAGDGTNQHIYLRGISTNLKPNDPLLISFASGTPEFHRIKEVKPDVAANRTLVISQTAATIAEAFATAKKRELSSDRSIINELTRRPSVQPAGSLRLPRSLPKQFSDKSESGYAVAGAFTLALQETLAEAAANAKVTEDSKIRVHALRVKASLFGHNHPGIPTYKRVEGEMMTIDGYTQPNLTDVWPKKMWDVGELSNIAIQHSDEQIKPETWLVIEYPKIGDNCGVTGWTHSVHKVNDARQATLSALGLSSTVALLNIIKPWLSGADLKLSIKCEPLLRDTIVHARSEELELAEEPINGPVCGDTEQRIELDGFYEGLESGRWVIVSGERKIAGTSGVRFSELAMIASVEQKFDDALRGDKSHTFVTLAEELQYCFKRDTVTIYGNVVKATHGETRKEVLGSGDGTKALQSFVLKQPPLTYVSASNPSGVDSTLKVFVNDVQWREADSLAGLAPTDRHFITKTDDEGKNTVVFGNGREGARLPTGMENIKAEYRNGIGKAGNVKAGQISLLTTRPLGVKEVINPLRASGGADKETRDQARKNAPLAMMALDRLVSAQDYEDFSLIYAGIGKARALAISEGRRQLVHITIAGADDIPIDKNSDLYRNLRQALLDFGDPYQAIQLEIRELMLIVISARIRILPEYQWEPVVAQVRSALLDAFSFERRELGQDVLLSEVISVMQAVRGVAYVDVDVLRGIPEKIPDTQKPGQRRLLTPAEIASQVTLPLKDEQGIILGEPLSRITVNLAGRLAGTILPAQLAFLTPEVPETLILNQIT